MATKKGTRKLKRFSRKTRSVNKKHRGGVGPNYGPLTARELRYNQQNKVCQAKKTIGCALSSECKTQNSRCVPKHNYHHSRWDFKTYDDYKKYAKEKGW